MCAHARETLTRAGLAGAQEVALTALHDHYDLEAAAEARVRDFAGDRESPLRIGEPTRRELVALHRLYGERIVEARTIAGMRACDIASHLGLTAAGVGYLERGEIDAVPAWMLARVATVTGCRLDFLAGLVEESEHGESVDLREIVMPALLHADTERAMHALELARQRALLNSFLDAAGKAQEALRRVAELNPEAWQELRGGGSLVAAVDACMATARRAIPRPEAVT